MFRTVYRLPFKLLGIPVQLDITFLVILPLLAWIIGRDLALYVNLFNVPVDPAPLQEGYTPYWIGLMAALGLFISVVIHELGHSVVGQAYGIKIRNITLWILGGMAQFERMPKRPGREAIMAIAGPITSYLVAAACWVLIFAVPATLPTLLFVLHYLLFMNIILATFNLLPALPMDGGRVLRSLLALKMPHIRATQVAAGVSKMLALGLGILGFISLNFFLMLIALFIYIAVTGETQSATVSEMLQGIKVSDLMRRKVQTVSPDTPVPELIQRMFEERRFGYPVLSSSGDLVGIVTLKDIQSLERDTNGNGTPRVEEIMSPQVTTIGEDQTALEAFERMSRNNFGRLVVLDSHERLTGIISRTDLMRVIQVRMVGLSVDSPPQVAH
jgi:Zn-dependent protease/CBS domain-containing protein